MGVFKCQMALSQQLSCEQGNQETLSPRAKNNHRSSMLTPCRRLGLSRKTHCVSVSPACGPNEVSLLCVEKSTDFLNTKLVNGEDTDNSVDKNLSNKKRRTGKLMYGNGNFKSPFKSPSEKRIHNVCLANDKKLQLVANTRNKFATTALSSPIVGHVNCVSENAKKFITGSVEKCENSVNTRSVTQKQTTESDKAGHTCETEKQPNASSKFIDHQKCVDNIPHCTGEAWAATMSRVRAKEDVLSGLEEKYERKQRLIEELQEETGQWLTGARTAALDLLTRYRDMDGTVTMERLLQGLGVPAELLRYDPENDEFQ